MSRRPHFFPTDIGVIMHEFHWVEVPIRCANPSQSVGRASLDDALRTLWKLQRRKRSRAGSAA